MQAVLLYGRVVARALTSGIAESHAQIQNHRKSCSTPCPSTDFRPLNLVTAIAGLSKSHSPARIQTKWSFGDDAYFVASCKCADVIGVADGVGGWRDYGVDPSLFPKSLMSTCERLVNMESFKIREPIELLTKSYHEIRENKERLIGSCTACLICLSKDDKCVHTANLGDSGYIHIRQGRVVSRSEEQQHYFNTPFQLAVVPTTMEGMVLSDRPEAASQSSFNVEGGDIIVLGTDGLFDNMHEEMILHHVNKLKDCKFESLQKIANAIAQHAHQLAFDPDYMSPFAMNAACNGFNMKGGKPDDITVLLARVSDDPDS